MRFFIHSNRLPLNRHLLFFQKLMLVAFFLFAFLARHQAQVMYALSGNALVSFDLANPTAVLGNVTITGISAGQVVEGIDIRPNTGQLYAIGYTQATGEARLYTINSITGAATAIGAAPVMLQPNMGEVNFDFNPTVDRIRVTGSNTANYRLHPVTGAIAATDGALAFALTDVNVAATPYIVAGAYTNSYIASGATTLYNYDAILNVLTSQNPPNNGTQNTIGASGITVDPINPAVDLDIFFNPLTQTNTAVLSAGSPVPGITNFYNVNLTTGAATLLTPLGVPLAVDDIAIAIDQPVPPVVTGQLVYALTTSNNLISFDSDLPGVIRSIVATSGVFAAQPLAGLDFRPATGELYGIGYNNASGMARLYTLNLTTGAATAIGMDSVMLQPGMGVVSLDFNPTVDRIRVMGRNGANYRMHPTTGAVVATDGTLAFATGDPNQSAIPNIGAAAYTNSFNGSTTTTLFDYDLILNVLATQIPPNNGTLNTIGASGIMVNAASPSVDLDIFYEYTDASNAAYLSANTGTGMNDHFYKIDLATGAATLVGSIGLGVPVKNIAVVLDTPPPASTTFVAHLSGHNQAFPVASAGSGEITATLTGNELVVTGSYGGMTGLIDPNIAGGAHIHAGYAGQNGGIELPLVPTPGTDLTGGTFAALLNTFTLTQAQIDLLETRQLYVNIHTTAFAAGEIRGQLLPEAAGYFSTNLFGSNEVPGVISGGSGALALELHTDTLVVSGSFGHLNGSFDAAIAGGAHLHLGLTGRTGGIAVALSATVDADLHGGVFAAANNRFVLTPDQLTALQSHQLYANIHTSAQAAGEIRGQVVGAADAVYRAHLSGANEYPFVTSMAVGQVIAELQGNMLMVSGAFSGLESAASAAHIHLGTAGTGGGVVFELEMALDAGATSGMFTASANTFALTADEVADFLNREFYVNIHTANYPAGEIRGQFLLESQVFFNAYLTGSQSVPDASSGGHGVVAAEISGNRLTLSGSFSELASGVDLSIGGGTHLHIGLPGTTGSVLFPLLASLDPDLTGGVYEPSLNTLTLDSVQLQAVLDRATYINIHTLDLPNGEIRGNLLAEAAAYFCSPFSGVSQTPAVDANGTGMLILEVSGNSATAMGAFTDLDTDFDGNIAGGAHLHNGLAGSNGGIAVELKATVAADLRNGSFEALDNTFGVSNDLLMALRDRMLYANIHTTGNASGEIRGQVMPLANAYFHTTLAGVNEAMPVISNGTGSLKLELNGDQLTCTGSFASLDGEFDANIAGGSHIHIGEPGAGGGIVLELDANVNADLQSGAYLAENNTFTLTSDQIASLRNGELYANIHTSLEAAGEVRGQILPEINFFPDSSMLTSPLPGALVDVQGLPTELLTINWLPATDPDGDNIVYVWQVATTADFSNIVYMQAAGSDLLTTVTYGELDALLAANGVLVGATVTLHHRIVVTDGSNATPGQGSQAQFARGIVSSSGEVFSELSGLSVFPNLTAGQPVTLQVTAEKSASATLLVMDSFGKLMEASEWQLAPGQQGRSVRMDYAPGTYYLTVKTGAGFLPTQKVVLTR